MILDNLKKQEEALAQLCEKIEGLKKTITGYTNLLKQAKRMLGDADEEIERLLGYVTHKSHCGIVGSYGYCTCGLDKKEESDDKGGSGKAD